MANNPPQIKSHGKNIKSINVLCWTVRYTHTVTFAFDSNIQIIIKMHTKSTNDIYLEIVLVVIFLGNVFAKSFFFHF